MRTKINIHIILPEPVASYIMERMDQFVVAQSQEIWNTSESVELPDFIALPHTLLKKNNLHCLFEHKNCAVIGQGYIKYIVNI